MLFAAGLSYAFVPCLILPSNIFKWDLVLIKLLFALYAFLKAELCLHHVVLNQGVACVCVDNPHFAKSNLKQKSINLFGIASQICHRLQRARLPQQGHKLN